MSYTLSFIHLWLNGFSLELYFRFNFFCWCYKERIKKTGNARQLPYCYILYYLMHWEYIYSSVTLRSHSQPESQSCSQLMDEQKKEIIFVELIDSFLILMSKKKLLWSKKKPEPADARGGHESFMESFVCQNVYNRKLNNFTRFCTYSSEVKPIFV